MSSTFRKVPPGQWELFRRNPVTYLARWLYMRRVTIESPSSLSSPISVVCISDTHTTKPTLPDGDLLLHAGELSQSGSFEEIQSQLDWLKEQPHRYKVVIGGNHDLLLDPAFVSRFPERIIEEPGISRADFDWGDVIYLCNNFATLNFPDGRSLKTYGSPWTKQFGTWAFQYPPIRDVWTQLVPHDTDVLLTHGPPKGHLDCDGLGSEFLLKEIWRAKPRLVVFGHIHAGYGQEEVAFDAVQSAYDGVMLAEKGLVAVVVMACLVLLQKLLVMMPFSKWRAHPTSATFINASIVGGFKNQLKRPAITIDI